MVEHFNYSDLKSEMIQDRLVVGILNKSLSERLQLDPNLMLEVKKMVRQCEGVQEQQQMFSGAVASSLNEV